MHLLPAVDHSVPPVDAGRLAEHPPVSGREDVGDPNRHVDDLDTIERHAVHHRHGQIRSSRRRGGGTQLGERFSVNACHPSMISSPAMLASMAIRS